jgi:hypothetical protein
VCVLVRVCMCVCLIVCDLEISALKWFLSEQVTPVFCRNRRSGGPQTVGINLIYLQLDAQNSCLFTYNTFIKILYMFRALLCSSSGGLRRNCVYAASGTVTLQVTILCTG